METKRDYEICGYCGHKKEPASGVSWLCTECRNTNIVNKPIKTYANEEVSNSTHLHYRVYCKECKTRAVIWVKKDTETINCPECGKPCSMMHKLNPKGDCYSDGVWGERRLMLTPFPPRKSIACECGVSYRYLMKPPTKCKRCGKKIV